MPKKIPIRKYALILLVVIAAAIRIFAAFPSAVESYYSTGIYPYIGKVQRIITGWVPFSLGDFLYFFAGLYLIYQVYKLIKRISKRSANRAYLKNVAINFITGVLIVYVSFNVLWGLNYNRRGIGYQFDLQDLDYDSSDLRRVTEMVAQKMNELQPASLTTRKLLKSKKHLFRTSIAAYGKFSDNTNALHYEDPSVKPSLYSYLGNYLGFTGYYNPFSGEGQVNTTIPLFTRPFTTCHEIGHQLGYAKESEANFAAYLSASSSSDPSFRYAVYFELFAYAARYLRYTDSAVLNNISAQLSPAVKQDIAELRAFYESYENPLETAIDRLYSQYLKANQQPTGKMSYSEVVAMLIAYYKKNGKV